MEISNPENHSGNWQELRQILKEKQFGKLFAGATENTLIQFFRYCFVGGAATVIDWGVSALLFSWCFIRVMQFSQMGFLLWQDCLQITF